MIENIYLKNFKAFKEITVNFSNLTILSGVNGGGKSSIIQAILLLVQTRMPMPRTRGDYGGILLNGYYLKFYDKKEIQYIAGGDYVFIQINDKLKVDLTQESYNAQIETDSIEIGFYDNFDFISADRFGPRRYHEDVVLPDLMVGKYGENTMSILCEFYSEIGVSIEENLLKIFGEKITIQPTLKNDTHISSIGIKNYQSIDADYFNPIHMPFGVSYVLPILVALSMAQLNESENKENTILIIIENPEAHLHPAAQSNLGQLLALKTSPKVQIIIETHSEHIINGALKTIKSKELNPEQVLINFFIKGESLGSHMVHEIKINENAELSEWPTGFMDQFSLDSLEILGS